MADAAQNAAGGGGELFSEEPTRSDLRLVTSAIHRGFPISEAMYKLCPGWAANVLAGRDIRGEPKKFDERTEARAVEALIKMSEHNRRLNPAPLEVDVNVKLTPEQRKHELRAIWEEIQGLPGEDGEDDGSASAGVPADGAGAQPAQSSQPDIRPPGSNGSAA